MFEFYSGLSGLGLFYFWTGLVASTLLGIQTLVRLIGLDHGDGDFDAGHDADPSFGHGFHPFTVGNLIAFFAAFGWAGLAALLYQWGGPLSIVSAFFAGTILMFAAALLWFAFSKAADSGTMNIRNAVGSVGKVYLVVPPKGSGTAGMVHVTIQGAMRELPAVSEERDEMDVGTLVRVVSVSDDTLTVVRA